MKLLALISGGKDSVLSMLLAQAFGHEIVGLVNLAPRMNPTCKNGAGGGNDDHDSASALAALKVGDIDSHCFQTVGHQAVDALARHCLQLPLFRNSIARHQSINTSLEYLEKPDQQPQAQATDGEMCDEVEVLFETIKSATESLLRSSNNSIIVQGVCSGAILSSYQRLRVERVCQRLGLQSFSFLWQRSARNVLDLAAQFGVHAMLIKIASYGLKPAMLGQSLTAPAIRGTLLRLHDQGMGHAAGEGGEYETFVLDCPALMHKSGHKLAAKIIDHGEQGGEGIVINGNESNGEGTLLFDVSVVDSTDEEREAGGKMAAALPQLARQGALDDEAFVGYCTSEKAAQAVAETSKLMMSSSDSETVAAAARLVEFILSGRQNNNNNNNDAGKSDDGDGDAVECALQFHLYSKSSDNSLPPGEQAKEIFARYHHSSPSSSSPAAAAASAALAAVVYTQVFGSQFSHFAAVNAAYLDVFHRTVPAPSRAFVGLGQHNQMRISIVSIAPKFASTIDRKVLHVQSISCWAAACIGPYAQSQSLSCRKCGEKVVLTAGSIGLEPASMVPAGGPGSRYPSLSSSSSCSSSAESASEWSRRLFQECVMLLANLKAVLRQSGNSCGMDAIRFGTLFFSTSRLFADEAAASAGRKQRETDAVAIFLQAWKTVAMASETESTLLDKIFGPSGSFNLRVVFLESLPRDTAAELCVGAVTNRGCLEEQQETETASVCECRLADVALPRFFAATLLRYLGEVNVT